MGQNFKRKLLVITNIYPTKFIRDIFQNPTVIIVSEDKLLDSMWRQVYSDIITASNTDETLNLDDEIMTFDNGSIYSDSEEFYFANMLPQQVIEHSDIIKTAIKNKDMSVFNYYSANTSPDYTNFVMTFNDVKQDLSLDYNNSDEMIAKNVNKSDFWIKEMGFKGGM